MVARIKHPANILRGSAAVRPIQRFLDWSDRLAFAQNKEKARLAKRTMPSVPEPIRVSSPNTSGVHVKGALGGGSGYSLNNDKTPQ